MVFYVFSCCLFSVYGVMCCFVLGLVFDARCVAVALIWFVYVVVTCFGMLHCVMCCYVHCCDVCCFELRCYVCVVVVMLCVVVLCCVLCVC